jgi:transposase
MTQRSCFRPTPEANIVGYGLVSHPTNPLRVKCRRIATPYDKLAANYFAFIQLASIKRWLRVNESSP